jgi:hypothetical protein
MNSYAYAGLAVSSSVGSNALAVAASCYVAEQGAACLLALCLHRPAGQLCGHLISFFI